MGISFKVFLAQSLRPGATCGRLTNKEKRGNLSTMRKLFLLCTLVVTACSLFQKKEERFVNPLFYETLYPIPNTDTEKRLTPTKIYSKSVDPELDCQLLENNQTEVVLSCIIEENYSLLFKYVISDDFYTENCQLIEQYVRHPDSSKWPSFPTSFCIHKDEV